MSARAPVGEERDERGHRVGGVPCRVPHQRGDPLGVGDLLDRVAPAAQAVGERIQRRGTGVGEVVNPGVSGMAGGDVPDDAGEAVGRQEVQRQPEEQTMGAVLRGRRTAPTSGMAAGAPHQGSDA